MKTPPNICVLTGLAIHQVVGEDDKFLTYQNPAVGTAKVSWDVIEAHLHQTENRFKYPILTGLCRQAHEAGQEPPAITGEFKLKLMHTYPYPKGFNEKVRHLLSYLYERGGKDRRPITLNSYNDYPLCFADDGLEFERVLDYLFEEKYWLKHGTKAGWAHGMFKYSDVLFTDNGIEEAEKDKPKLPMVGLVSQEITSGDAAVDEKINVARELFFREPHTMEHMRSACVALAAVLEPLKKDLTPIFTSSDVSDFFMMVNRFDIRHNKNTTANLEHPEQLEWVFYTLLNTINTYSKLKSRLIRL